jgi:hypothetical protein
MTLHLHFLEALGPNDRPKLVMTQFWLKEVDLEPVTVTYGKFNFGNKQNRTKGDPNSLCQLILHGEAIEGELAKNLWETARKKVRDKPTYLQMLFGLEANQEIPEQWLLCKEEICQLGSELEAATIEYFLHQKVSAAQGAYRPVEKERPSGPGARSRTTPLRPLSKEERRNLARRMLGDVRITKITIDVRKNNVGEMKDGNAEGILPLNSKDTFELKVTCDKPAYLYVFWFGSSGKRAAPIFPWAYTQGWADPKATERDQPRENLVLTEAYRTDLPEQGRRFRSVGDPGAEMLVVLAHIEPLRTDDLRRYFGGFPKGKVEPLGWRTETELEIMPLETGVVSETADLGGGPDPEEDALGRVASWIGRLQMYVDDAQGLVIPTVGGK